MSVAQSTKKNVPYNHGIWGPCVHMDACQWLRLPFGRGSEACSIVLRLTRFTVSLVARPKSSRFVNRQGHALLFRPEALSNLARPPRAWPSFVPSSCRKTKFCSIKCKAGCAHHQEARPSFVPSSSSKAESCSIVHGQSAVLFFQEEDIPRVSGHYEERDLGHWFCPWWLC